MGLIKLFKPRESEEREFEGYFDLDEGVEEDHDNGLMSHDAILEIVNRYVGAVKMFDSVMEASKTINNLIKPISQAGESFSFGAYKSGKGNFSSITRDTFKKDLQKQAWHSVFKKMNIGKYVTSSVMADINKFVEKQENVPFTRKNIFKMCEVIYGTRKQTMNKVIVEVFDNLTKHHHENRFQKEGWKTNSEYRVNKKFIINYGSIKMNWDGKMDAKYGYYNSGQIMDDLTKALCFVMGEDYSTKSDWCKTVKNYEFGKWYDFNFFEFKGFKKGTTHVKFKDEKVWEQFNVEACKAKGFQLASKFTSDFRKKGSGVEVYK